MWSILTLTSELCECLAKVPMTIFQSLNGRIRDWVVNIKLGKGCLCWQNPQHFPEIFQVLKNSLLLAYWYVYVSCLNFFSKLCIVHCKRGATCAQPVVGHSWLLLRFSWWWEIGALKVEVLMVHAEIMWTEGLRLLDFQKFTGLKKSFTSRQGDLVPNTLGIAKYKDPL